MRIAASALLYFVIVFGAGFLLGPIRVFWLEPQVGPTIAVLCEAPLLLVIIVVAARWVPLKLRLIREPKSLALMGIGALILQQLADVFVGVRLAASRSPSSSRTSPRPPGSSMLASCWCSR
jgi:hypothetical protein